MTNTFKKLLTFKAEAISDNSVRIAGYIAKYNNIDSQGDRFLTGAFSESIAKLGETGEKIGMYWMHKMDSVIGGFDVLLEKDDGLWGEGEIIMEEPLAKQVGLSVKKGYINAFSVGGIINEYKSEEGVRNISKATITEGSVVSRGANSDAKIVSVLKSAETLKEVHEVLKMYGITDDVQNLIISKISSIKNSHLKDREGQAQEKAARVEEVDNQAYAKALESLTELNQILKGL